MSLTITVFFSTIAIMAQIRNQALLKKLAQRIKDLREGEGITQETFFNDTGIHLGRIETAKINVSVSTLEAICKYFRISMSQFFKDL